jgi:signal recognition particle subunit SRP54
MTPEERRNPKVISGSRRSRIARGSGTTTAQVNQLLKQFRQVQQMMEGMPLAARAVKKAKGKGKKARGRAQRARGLPPGLPKGLGDLGDLGDLPRGLGGLADDRSSLSDRGPR